MMTGSMVVVVSLLYLLLLFAVAYVGDKRADAGRSLIAHPSIYALSLAVYCTTWTYYGSVGRAASSGFGFVPIFLGPTLMVGLWWFVMLKMVRISKTLRITSIADFIASRYGKSHLLGGLVTVIAVLGVIPYIALQLKALSTSFAILIQYPAIIMPPKTANMPWLTDTTLYIALIMAAFTILFGTRHLDATERHEGMVAAVAFESLVKLLIFLAVGAYVTFGIFDGFADLFSRAAATPGLARLMTMGASGNSYGSWFAMTLLSMLALMFLPRQFQVGVVENVNENHLRRAIWLFPLYLLLINIFVLPIALGGLMHFAGRDVDADTFVLTLPMAFGDGWLALLVFIGGLSAATGMVIVETIALSTMVCNDLVMPFLLRYRWLPLQGEADLSGVLLGIRRWAIVLILLLGYLYFRFAGEAHALVSIGLISFAAVAQFAPAMFGGMYWHGATRSGALAGLSCGFAVWLYTLLLPSFAKSGWLPADFLRSGLFGIESLRPQELFGLQGIDPIAHSLYWSLLANIAAYVWVSLRRRPNAVEAGQATLFVDVFKQTRPDGEAFWRGSAHVKDLLPLIGRFIGRERAYKVFADYAESRGVTGVEALQADAALVHFAETTLAGAIGSASARVMVASVVQEEPLGIDEVMNILDEASQILAYSHRLEQKSQELEAATRELSAANERLKEVDRLKDDFMSSVTHELRTPLTSIRAFSEMLLEDPEIDVADRTRFLGIIVSEAERLTRLVNQVLDMAKLEAGHAEWHNGEVSLIEVVEQAVAATSQLFKDRKVDLAVQLPGHIPLLLADRDRLVQVVLNLLSNAVKFVAQGKGRVTIALRETSGGLRVDVRDNGPGLSAEEQAIVFEKFRQGGDAMTDKPQGTGLGLPISRQIVEHYGGRLWVDSTPGEGACFSFLLPCGKSTETKDEAG
ncbi:MAG: histidine kinase [Proteobacteria bacterium]|nr:histidine kinase [Pseudomonadota bacterium]